MSARLTFFGAVQEVTGSCYLLQTDSASVLLECGMHQGPPDVECLNAEPFPFDVTGLDAVVLSHGHLDHSGLLPKLAKVGYKGPVYSAHSTVSLLKIMLMDAAYLAQRDTEWENIKRRRAGRSPLEPLYTLDDVRRILNQCQTLPYGREIEIADGVRLGYRDAGHILGSAHVCLNVRSGNKNKRLVFSGDIGNPESVLMHDADPFHRADVVLMESTYGDRDHQSMASTLEELATILQTADRQGGNVLIPAFAVGRTQEVIYHLLLLRKQGRLSQQQVFLDSPMAIEVSELYLNNLEALDQVDIDALTDNHRLSLDEMLRFIHPTRTPEESMALNQITGGAIIIAGSGMCNGGRIRHHFKHNLWRRETHVVMVGFQAAGTLGRRLVDGADEIRLFGDEIAVRAQIHTLGGYSAHAGRRDLLRWAAAIKGDPHFYLVHGEPQALEALKAGLEQELEARVSMPAFGEVVPLT
jgi:metallo-beta-lactamase family protein